MTRREFIEQSTLLSTLAVSTPFITFKKVAKYRTALIGSGWWGMNILREAIRSGAIEVVALCDVDSFAARREAFRSDASPTAHPRSAR